MGFALYYNLKNSVLSVNDSRINTRPTKESE